jgi:hypothetical protein
MNNLSESIAGTHPLRGFGVDGLFRGSLSASASVPGNLDFTWSQLTGKSYQAQASLDLTPDSWQPLGDSITATVSGNNLFSFHPNGSPSFFRVGVHDIDPDGDTLSSWEEGLLNTNPADPDTDGDGVDDNSNGTLETAEVKTIFQKTPKVNTNAAKLISAFATGSKSIPGTFVLYGNSISANGIGTPAAGGLSLPLGAKWDNANEAETHLFDFPDGSDLSEQIKASNTIKLLFRRIISSNKTEILGFTQTGSWTTHILVDVEDQNVDFKQDGSKSDMALSLGKCKFRGDLEVEIMAVSGGFQVRHVKLSGIFTDLYDFSWPGGIVSVLGVTFDIGNATKTQAGHATLTAAPHPDAGRIFYTRVATFNVDKEFFGIF